MTNRAKLARLPLVIVQLRRRAGFKSQNAAAVAIRKQTGAWLNKSQISHWERGKAMAFGQDDRRLALISEQTSEQVA